MEPSFNNIRFRHFIPNSPNTPQARKRHYTDIDPTDYYGVLDHENVHKRPCPEYTNGLGMHEEMRDHDGMLWHDHLRASPMEQMSHQSLESMANHYSEPVMNQVIDPALEPTFEPSIPQVAVKDTGKTKKKGPVPTNRKIPAHYDEANQEDRMLWDERQAGTPWVVVRAEWERITGEKVGASTLPNRYDRIRSNFSKLKPDDEAIFIKTLTDLEAKFALEKWSKVAAELEEQHGTIKYPPKVLEKAWKEISERSES